MPANIAYYKQEATSTLLHNKHTTPAPLPIYYTGPISRHAFGCTSPLPDKPYRSNASDEIVIWRMALPHRLVTITLMLDLVNFTGKVKVVTEQVELRSVYTLFLDLLDECLNVDDIVSVLSTAFRSVQVLAKLIFVNDLERPSLLDNKNANLYLIDLSTWVFVRGCIEMPLEKISLVRNLIDSGDRYFLLLPLS
ncbi:hypothetical protein B0J14DRAFT_605068 [Halenospora varia]|nr:hypothetical protein B0J14DRAFT_605068 [Halenospora varia]